MEKEDFAEDEEQDSSSGTPSRAARILQERHERRHRKASVGKLISYIIALIAILLLMFWLKRGI